jgi:KDO2-lipid IV(A) lauroyltransferase
MNQLATYIMPPPSRWHYFILRIPIWLFSSIPLPILHLLSSTLTVLLRDILRYRRNIVDTNLRNAFPNKTPQEIIRIRNEYYLHLMDVTLETFHMAGLSYAQLKKRFVFENMTMVDDLIKEHKMVLLAMGHCGNWEWGGSSFSINSATPTYTLYHPLSNAFFNWHVFHLRNKFKINLIPMQQTARAVSQIAQTHCLLAFIADQSPVPETAYWTTFLNQDTAFFNGYAKLAAKYKTPVVFASIKKVGRGKYQCAFVAIKTAHEDCSADDVVERFARLLEKDIEAQPENWLWSHRRWKHKRK